MRRAAGTGPGEQQHPPVGEHTEARGDERPPAVEEQRTVDRHQHVEEAKDRIRAPREVDQRGDDGDVGRDVERREAAWASNAREHQPVEDGGEEGEGDGAVQATPAGSVDIPERRVEGKCYAEAHERQREPRAHQHHQTLLEGLRAPEQRKRPVSG